MRGARSLAKGFRFGPYEADLQAGELSKHGLRIQLQDKSFEVLAALLEHPGELVSREELRRLLWPAGITVEFENSLNSAVNRLREALRDEARRPRYIETLHRRGYRFIAPVEQVRTVPPRLAVLPFENLSHEPAHDFFADAVTDALITELGSISALRVISRQSVLHLKGTRRTAPEIARELKVDAIVEGAVVQSADRVRATAQLIQAEPEQHLWAKAYEFDAADLLTTQARAAKAIAEAIQVALRSHEVARLGRARPVDPEAHVAYLKGRHHIGIWTGESLKKALDYFQLALQKDPTHALACAHLADCYTNLGFWGHIPFQEAFKRGKEAALRAQALDDALSTAHWAFAWNTWYLDRNLAACEAEILRALQLNPSDERAHESYAFLLATAREDCARAASEIRLALDLDPLSQRVNATAAWIYLFMQDYERVIEQSRRTLDLFPETLHSYYTIGLAELCKRRFAQAIAAFERAAAIAPNPLPLVYAACARARSAGPRAALPCLNDLLSRSGREYIMPRCFAFLYAALGEPDRAFEWLDQAYELHDPGLFYMRVMPLFAPLHSDPRFERMLERLGIGHARHSTPVCRPPAQPA